MKIIATPMCEEVVKLAGIKDYVVNKNPDLEDGDLAILLSESKVKMDSLPIKLNTSRQLFESIREVSKLTPHELSDSEILEFFEGYDLCVKYLKDYSNPQVKVKVLSIFLTDIVENIGFEITDENYDYIIYPDYLKENVQNEEAILVEIPSHTSVSKNPFERIQSRYAILEKLI
jgi:segregation and condensation protein B